ncbi:TetR family transcriptional regulator [Streptomyces sp. Ru62]|uniref:TetR/AcrR family transcriptional regulator n=1 Tax=Streptomyces sp. Ru62 TaxID=2080745 RepID=UPI000CDDF662|nr:TetR/AcrR family transcriptional regulator [Streptomyces sp. Ru62]POX60488.1 TetR family transcriptional regulator [Streptomyces sp. Ru62]
MIRRPYHHGDLPAELLARVEKTVREKGMGALSLRALARDIGVSPAAPSRHFRNKQALLDALALRGFERLAAATGHARASAGGTFAERLGAVARAYLAFALANGALFDLMCQAGTAVRTSAELHEAARRWSGQLVALVADGQGRGEIRTGTPERVALPVFAALHGYVRLAVDGVLPTELAEHSLDDVIESVLRGCRP